MAVTVKQIAEAAGVSHPVVSKVLYGGTSTVNVSEKRREQILKVAKEMGFTPDWRARAFREKRTRTVGLLAIDRTYTRLMSTQVLSGLVHHLGQVDYQLGFATRSRTKGWQEVIGDRRYDGCLIDYYIDDDEVQAARRSGVPLVLLNADPDRAADFGDFPLVSVDYAAVGEAAVRHVLDRGADVVHLVIDRMHDGHEHEVAFWPIRNRLIGGRRAAEAAGVECRTAVWSEVVEAVRDNRAGKRPGIVTTNSFLADLLIPTLGAAGVRLPEDALLTMAGSTDNPGPTYVAEPFDLMTEYATAALLRLMRPEDEHPTPADAAHDVPGPGDVLLLGPDGLRTSVTTTGKLPPDVNF